MIAWQIWTTKKINKVSQPGGNGLGSRRKKFGGMEVSEARRLKAVEDENAKLKKLLAESLLDNEALEAALNRKY